MWLASHWSVKSFAFSKKMFDLVFKRATFDAPVDASVGPTVPTKTRNKRGVIVEEVTRDALDLTVLLDRSVLLVVYNLPVTFCA